jgi:hypothetical protein
MQRQNEARQRARMKTWRIVAILAVIVTVFGVMRRVTGSTVLPNVTDVEIIGILVGLVVGALVALWWLERRT